MHEDGFVATSAVWAIITVCLTIFSFPWILVVWASGFLVVFYWFWKNQRMCKHRDESLFISFLWPFFVPAFLVLRNYKLREIIAH